MLSSGGRASGVAVMVGRFTFARLASLVAACAAAFGFWLVPFQPAGAHIYPQPYGSAKVYPYNGFLFMSESRSFLGDIVYSDNVCSPTDVRRVAQDSAFAAITNSTDNILGFDPPWFQGVEWFHSDCNFTSSANGPRQGTSAVYPNYLIQTGIYYDPSPVHFKQNDGSYITGRVQRLMASSNYCAYNGASYPCGTRDWVHMNNVLFLSYNATTQMRMVLHETGHSQGLSDAPSSECSTATIMKSGSPCTFHSYNEWQQHDRDNIRSIYVK